MAAPTDAAIAELKSALEKCCADLAAALDELPAEEPGASGTSGSNTGTGTGTGTGTETGTGTGTGTGSTAAAANRLRWRSLVLGSIPGVDQIVSIVQPPLKVIIAILQVIQALLKALAAILIGLPDPFKALILAAYSLLTDIINDLLNCGVYLYADVPGLLPSETSLADTGLVISPPKEFKAGQALESLPTVPDGFQRWASRFSASFDDPGDLSRPTVTTGAPVQAVFIMMAAPSLDALRQAVYLLGQLLNIDAFKKAFEKYPKGARDPRRSRSRARSVAPDWKSTRLQDLFPPLRNLLMLPEALKGLLLSVDQLSQLIKDLAKAMESKAQVLMKLADAVKAVIDLLEALKSSGMYVLPVATKGGIEGLKTAFIEATNRPPGGYVGGICFLAAGPNLAKAAMLWELLGVSAAMDVMEGDMTLKDAIEQAKAGALGQAASVLEAGVNESKDAWGQFKSQARKAGDEFVQAIEDAPGDFARALGRTPEELVKLAESSRSELTGMMEDAQGFLPTDKNIQEGIAATKQAQRRGARSLAMGYGGATPDELPPSPQPPVKKEGT